MHIFFNLKYSSQWGEQVFIIGNHNKLGNFNEANAIPLKYCNDNLWNIEIELENENNQIEYTYFIINSTGIKSYSSLTFNITVSLKNKNNITTSDTFVNSANIANVFLTKPFTNIIFNNNVKKTKNSEKKCTHLFKVKAAQMQPNNTIHIIGNHSILGNWEVKNAPIFKYENGFYYAEITFPKQDLLIEYKYAIYNSNTNEVEYFEDGKNRQLLIEQNENGKVIINDGILNTNINNWKAAGIAIPVFSLRTKNSFGVGEFSDIKLLAKWCKLTNLKLIQLLPINDTIFNKTSSDSYPYSANSSFALHPMYINLLEVGILPKDNKFALNYTKQLRKLNKLDSLDYEAIIKFKLGYLKEYFKLNITLLNDQNFIDFYSQNETWLKPYSVYCYLREKNKSTNFSKWGKFETYNEIEINKIANSNSKQYFEISFWYFVQYQLHLQLKSAVDYVHNLGIILKGDLPIGIGRTSCDAWQNPNLFNMNKQAGAPPDDFAIKGQNWSFPTYNWEAMQQNGFKWWRERFEKMSDYFDAFRIDHILGFFRIWSIPLNEIQGIMGHFIPSIGIHINEFNENGIYFDAEKFTKPVFTIHQLQYFFNDKFEEILKQFFEQKNENIILKEEFNTQSKIENYFIANSLNSEIDNNLKLKLFDCISNVLFFEQENSDGLYFHFNFAMKNTITFQFLDEQQKHLLEKLYINYFYERQNDFWKNEGNKKLPILQKATNMLICGEDLGMVPKCVPEVMNELNILSLEVQRMPKASNSKFVDLKQVPYLSVATPSTHDMSTIRSWWEEDRNSTQFYYNNYLGHYGEAPQYCEPWIVKEIIQQHLTAPCMLSIFQLQDILGISSNLRRENPNDERINNPSNPKHYWCYRMHLKLEDLIKEKAFNNEIAEMIKYSNR